MQNLMKPLVGYIRRGEPIAIYDGRPNGELLLATGRVEDDNASDCLTITVGLVQTDRLFSVKKQIVESVGFGIVQACTTHWNTVQTVCNSQSDMS